jgi:RNA polymerase sigma factor (sigma-70 family)
MHLNLWSPYDPNDDPGALDTACEPVPVPDLSFVYDREAPRLRRFFARRGHMVDDAADLVQRSFVRLLGLSSEHLARIETPGAYLHRIACNLARDEARAAKRRPAAPSVFSEDAADPGSDPVPLLEARDMLMRVDAAIAALPERTREIFMAHRFEGLTYAAIAQRMAISVKTVEKHMSQALVSLHRLLAEPE